MNRDKIKEELYIVKRKIQAFFCSLPFYFCRIFPMKKNKVVMWTLETNGGFSCSPKYLANEILRKNHEGKTNYEIVWLVKDLEKVFPPEVMKVKSTLWSRAYHLSTAKFWVANTRTFLGTKKRKGTIYIQTWHGSISLKPIGKYRGDHFSKIAYLVSKADSDLIDYVLSGSKWCTQMWRDGLVYRGEIKELGTPRIDILFSGVNEKHQELRRIYGIPETAKICLYAPTFRGGSQSTKRSVVSEEPTIDFINLIRALETRFEGEWYIFLRLHPQLAIRMQNLTISQSNPRIIDVSQRPDMAEIMAATDAIITDYSTVIFEGFLTGQPGFIYADDIEVYISDRGTLMFDLDEIPFMVARNNDELVSNINNFDWEIYRKKCVEFISRMGINQEHYSSRKVVEFMQGLE